MNEDPTLLLRGIYIMSVETSILLCMESLFI